MFLVSLMIRASMFECPCHFQCKWRFGKAYEEELTEKTTFYVILRLGMMKMREEGIEWLPHLGWK